MKDYSKNTQIKSTGLQAETACYSEDMNEGVYNALLLCTCTAKISFCNRSVCNDGITLLGSAVHKAKEARPSIIFPTS